MHILYQIASLIIGPGLLFTGSPKLAYGAEPTDVCTAATVPYYGFPLITTKNISGTGRGRGSVEVTFSENSPFGISITENGSYRYDLDISLDRIKIRGAGELVAWVTTRDLSEIRKIGTLDTDHRIRGSVDWNKFLVVVTLESNENGDGGRWQGPIVFRGMSRSGMMHTMVGHGVLQQENCFAYGYDS